MKSESNFQSVWEYEVKDAYRAEFIEAYGSNGSWVSLFEHCKGYIKTELKQDARQRNRFLTIGTLSQRSQRCNRQ